MVQSFQFQKADPVKIAHDEMMRLAQAAASETDPDAQRARIHELRVYMDRLSPEVHAQLSAPTAPEVVLAEGVRAILAKIWKQLMG